MVERVKDDGSVDIVRLRDLKEGDRFRLYEKDNYLPGTFLATGDPEEENGVWGIKSRVLMVDEL